MPFACCFSAKNAVEPEELTPRPSKKIEENASTQSPLVSARSEKMKVHSAVSKVSKVVFRKLGFCDFMGILVLIGLVSWATVFD